MFDFQGGIPSLPDNFTVGDYDDEVPPVPIPNTEVKLIGAYDTWRAAAWENRSSPASEDRPQQGAVFCFARFYPECGPADGMFGAFLPRRRITAFYADILRRMIEKLRAAWYSGKACRAKTAGIMG